MDVGVLILRLGLGLTMAFFGSQKMFGTFGGMGYVDTVGMMHKQMGIPVVFAHLAILGEFLGGLGVLCGLLTSVASFGVACTMSVATFINMKGGAALAAIFSGEHGADPSKLFFPAILCLAAVALMIVGPGKLSLDAKFFRQSKR